MAMRALDLFCCGGGASAGLSAAGFEVVGVDIEPQPHYPYKFLRMDALKVSSFESFDFIWASPPCQEYSITKFMPSSTKLYPKLIEPIRRKLKRSGRLWVIENVPRAPLIDPVTLCGTMFGLKLLRHRIFESNFKIEVPEHLPHRGSTGSHRGYSRGHEYTCVAGNNYDAAEGREAMGIDWLPRHKLSQAIPPAYSEFIGSQALALLRFNPSA